MLATTMKTRLRPFQLTDGQAVTDLFNAYSKHLYGWEEFTLEDMLNDWTTPGLNLEETTRVLEGEAGEIIGYAEVWDVSKPHVTKYVWALLHPEHWDDKRYHQMLAWAEEVARERMPLAPEGTRVVMNQGTGSNDQRRKAALEAYGYELVRHWFRMQINLDQKPTPPTLPDGVKIEPINMESDFEAAILALEEGFRDHWGYVERSPEETLTHWQHFIENDPHFDPSLWLLAKADDKIIGTCRCEPRINEDPESAWVSQLCVIRPWRRKGLGKALLLTAFNEFFRRGKPRAGLAVDASSLTNATHLYEKAGMVVTLQYDTYQKELRPGRDLTTSDSQDQ